MRCYRFFGHARLDKSPYRDEAEEAEGRKKDAVKTARDKLRAGGATAEVDQVDADVDREMAAAVDHAIAAAAPDPTSMFRDVYAEGEPPPRPLRTHLNMILGE